MLEGVDLRGNFEDGGPKLNATLSDESAALLSTASAVLSGAGAEDAVRMHEGEQTIWVMRAERLQAFGLDVATLAQTLEVSGRQREPPC